MNLTKKEKRIGNVGKKSYDAALEQHPHVGLL